MSLVYIHGPYSVTEEDLANFNAGNIPTQAQLQQVLSIAMGAAVRSENFNGGWYRNGDTVPVPTSPVDGYVYSRAELLYSLMGLCTMPPGGGFVVGQTAFPGTSARGGAGQLLSLQGWYVDQATGVVTLNTHYFVTGGAETPTADGVVQIMIHGIRNR